MLAARADHGKFFQKGKLMINNIVAMRRWMQTRTRGISDRTIIWARYKDYKKDTGSALREELDGISTVVKIATVHDKRGRAR